MDESEKVFVCIRFYPMSEILGANGHVTVAVSTLYMMRRWFARGFNYYMNPFAGVSRALLQQVVADDINSMVIPLRYILI